MTSKDDLAKQLSEAGMSAIASRIAELSRRAFRLQTSSSKDEALPLTASKLGGLPDLPPNTPWPDDGNAHLSFLGQINLGEVPSASLLPKDGLLSFFYDSEQGAWGFDPKHKDFFRVFYFPNTRELQRLPAPAINANPRFLHTIKNILGQRSAGSFPIFNPLRVTFSPFLSIPDPSAKSIEDILLDLENDEVYGEFFEEYCGKGPDHQLLGWPNVIQSEMELECQLVTHGIYVGDALGHKDSRRKELEEGASDWILLFQIDSDDDANMMWGDLGRVYFWIRHQDLARADFTNAWCILQCY